MAHGVPSSVQIPRLGAHQWVRVAFGKQMHNIMKKKLETKATIPISGQYKSGKMSKGMRDDMNANSN